MSEQKQPYVRPGELGSADETYTVRVVADGTRTIAEVYDEPAEEVSPYSLPIGRGHAVRRKGDRRDQELGTTLAVARAFQSASEGLMDVVKDAVEG